MDDRKLEREIRKAIDGSAEAVWRHAAVLVRATRTGELTEEFTADDVPTYDAIADDVRTEYVQAVNNLVRETTLLVGALAQRNAKEHEDD